MTFLFAVHILHDAFISFTFTCRRGLPCVLNSSPVSVTLALHGTASLEQKWTGKKMFWRNTLEFSDEAFYKRLTAISLPLDGNAFQF